MPMATKASGSSMPRTEKEVWSSVEKVFLGNKLGCCNKEGIFTVHTECVADLTIEMIIFESLSTTFEASIIFEAAGALVEISSSLPNLNHNQVKLA